MRTQRACVQPPHTRTTHRHTSHTHTSHTQRAHALHADRSATPARARAEPATHCVRALPTLSSKPSAATSGTGRWWRTKKTSAGVSSDAPSSSAGVSPLKGCPLRTSSAGWRAGSWRYGFSSAAAGLAPPLREPMRYCAMMACTSGFWCCWYRPQNGSTEPPAGGAGDGRAGKAAVGRSNVLPWRPRRQQAVQCLHGESAHVCPLRAVPSPCSCRAPASMILTAPPGCCEVRAQRSRRVQRQRPPKRAAAWLQPHIAAGGHAASPVQ